MMETIVIGTQNEHKLLEIKKWLKKDLVFYSLKDFNPIGVIEETGESFFENALIKAKAVFKHTGMASLAEDSGLLIDALGGEPGINSARYAGEHSSTENLIRKVLKKMQPYEDLNRKACFHSTFVFYFCSTEGEEIVLKSEGNLFGFIAKVPQGNQGFGYDPIFIPKGYEKTLGQLGSIVKDKISHRAKALKTMLGLLENNKNRVSLKTKYYKKI